MKNTPIFFFVFLPFFLPAQTIDSVTIFLRLDSLIQISRHYTDQRNFEDALKIAFDVKNNVERHIGKDNSKYADCLFNIGRVYDFMRDMKKAEAYYLESKNIRERLIGKSHPDYAQSLNNLALLYKDINQFSKAEQLFHEVIIIREKVYGKKHPIYASAIDHLGTLYAQMGEYEKAEPLLIEAKQIREDSLVKDDAAFSVSLMNLAVLYYYTYKYEEAEHLWLEAKNIIEKTSGITHPNFMKILHNLGVLYMSMERYYESETMLLEAKKIKLKVIGNRHTDYISTLSKLAQLYGHLGNSNKSIQLYQEAIKSWEEVEGTSFTDYPLALVGLGYQYQNIQLYDEAISVYDKGMNKLKELLGSHHPLYIGHLRSVALMYTEMQEYKKALAINKKGLALAGKIWGKEHLFYANFLHSHGYILSLKGEGEKAISFLSKAKEIFINTTGKDNEDYSSILESLAISYFITGQYESAESLMAEAKKTQWQFFNKSALFLSENELFQYANTYIYSLQTCLSFAHIRSKANSQLPALAYEISLLYKGYLMTLTAETKKRILSDTTASELYNNYLSYHSRLATQYALPIAERNSTLVADLEEKANTLEKELARAVADYGEARKQISWQEIQAGLKPNEAAIEFIHFGYCTPNFTDSIFYSALVLRPGWESPRMVYLCEQRQLDSLLQEADVDITVEQLYTSRGITPGSKASSSQLYRLLWQPINSLLNGVNTVYFSPSGQLHRIAFSAIPIPDTNEVLADQYKLIQLFSTRSIVPPAQANHQDLVPASVALFGGIRYELINENTFTPLDSNELASVQLSTPLLPDTRINRGEGWQYLPGTAQEVSRLQEVFRQQGVSSTIWTDSLATEEEFKALDDTASSPAILHLATHGFFFPDPKLDKNRLHGLDGSSIPLSENPLMRSGLLLAGANQAWKEGKPLPGKEDGILTAYEIAQVNLSGTQLAVLSACETGLGDIQASEGVMGLQRAFKMAGVDKLIVSLWQVPDKQTAVFMESFYTNWLSKGSSIRDAFYDTQSQMRKRYKDPLVWAGFVLVE